MCHGPGPHGERALDPDCERNLARAGDTSVLRVAPNGHCWKSVTERKMNGLLGKDTSGLHLPARAGLSVAGRPQHRPALPHRCALRPSSCGSPLSCGLQPHGSVSDFRPSQAPSQTVPILPCRLGLAPSRAQRLQNRHAPSRSQKQTYWLHSQRAAKPLQGERLRRRASPIKENKTSQASLLLTNSQADTTLNSLLWQPSTGVKGGGWLSCGSRRGGAETRQTSFPRRPLEYPRRILPPTSD